MGEASSASSSVEVNPRWWIFTLLSFDRKRKKVVVFPVSPRRGEDRIVFYHEADCNDCILNLNALIEIFKILNIYCSIR